MLKPLSFVHSLYDPDYVSTDIFKSVTIASAFGQVPIRDALTDSVVGHAILDSYRHHLGGGEYLIRIVTTYLIKGRGTLTWMYNFQKTDTSYDMPTNTPHLSTLVSGTDEFYGASGTVRVVAHDNGMHNVDITFTL